MIQSKTFQNIQNKKSPLIYNLIFKDLGNPIMDLTWCIFGYLTYIEDA